MDTPLFEEGGAKHCRKVSYVLWPFAIIISMTLIICGIAAYIDFSRAKAHNQNDKTLLSINAESEIRETTVELALDVVNSEKIEQINTKASDESEIVMEQDITYIHSNESI